MLSLSTFREKKPGFSDILSYASMVENGILLNKNGSLSASFFYRGVDEVCSTASEKNTASARINSALAKLGSGWMLHQDSIRIQASDYLPGKTYFEDPVSQMIDDERRKLFESGSSQFESVYTLTLTYLPPKQRQTKLKGLVVSGAPEVARNIYKLIKEFKSSLDDFIETLSTAISITPMRSMHGSDKVFDPMLRYLNFCISGLNHPLQLPSVPMYLDCLLGAHDFHSGLTPKVGDRYISVVAVDGFPHDSYPGILSLLDETPLEFRWSTRFIFIDPEEAKGQLNKIRRKWQQKVRGFSDQIFQTSKGPVNEDALRMVQETQGAISDIESGIVAYGYYTCSIVLMAETQELVQQNAKLIRKIIQSNGFNCRIESINTVEAYLGTLPGHGEPNLRRPILHTMNLAHLLPVSATWAGQEYNPCPFYPKGSPSLLQGLTTGATPFRMNLHVDDVGQALVIGPPGSGKSTLLALIAAQFLKYENSTVFAFDKGNSLLALTLAVGGSHYNIGSETKELQFCPLQFIKSSSDISWAAEWLEGLLVFQGIQVLPEHRKKILKALKLTVESEGKSLYDFVTTIQDEDMRAALTHYTSFGQSGILDGKSDSLTLSEFNTFEIEKLMQQGDQNVIPVLQYLFKRIEDRLKGQPALLILDEAWLMLGHPVFKSKIVDWIRTFRKSNCAIVLSTQSPGEFAKSDIFDLVSSACKTKIYLPNEGASLDTTAQMYKLMGLNDTQIEILSRAIPKKHYFYSSPEGKRLFELGLGPRGLSFLGVSSKPQLKRIQQLSNQFGKDWTSVWLKERGL